MKIIPFIIGAFGLIPICKSAPFQGKKIPNHKIVVTEVIQTKSYTYLHAKENDTLKWLAVPSMAANAGETYYYSESLPMNDFESKELHRKFDLVLFLGGVSAEPLDKPKTAVPNGHGGNGQPYVRKAATEVKKEVKISVPNDCISISELFSKKESYAGKTVRIKGEVTKYSSEIMNKNWVHLQDGTENNGKFDLTITSANAAKVGDIVIFEGKISINKDFGYGYFFEVMMEDAIMK